MKKFIKDMFSNDSPTSSKRVVGTLCILVCLFVLIWCTITIIQAPAFATLVLCVGGTLLGIETIANIFNKTK